MSNLQPLAKACGIATAYIDVWGDHHAVSDTTLSRLLQTLKLPIDDDSAQRAIDDLQRQKDCPLAPITVIDEKRKTSLLVPGLASWTLTGELGFSLREDKAAREEIILPPLERGYYTLEAILSNGRQLASRLIVAPPACWRPEKLADEKLWGISLQLYSLRSKGNMGIGDFGDLAVLVEKSAALGADLIGINPPNALFLNNPGHYAPYSPSNRFFLNPLYIDVAAVEGFDEDDKIKQVWNDSTFRQQLTIAREAELIDYPLISHLKQTIFQPLFAIFQAQAEQDKFNAFCREGGVALRNAALFEALHEYFNRKESRVTCWREWPEPFRSANSPEVQAFATEHAARITFYMWLQWIADRQLEHAQQTALAKGMSIGLYRDLAVGCDKSSAEAWALNDLFLNGAAIGAPPDELNPGGQNWGLLAFNPIHIRRDLQPFIDLLRANMRHARALRIDHAFGLVRLFLIPEGATPKDGAYIEYPLDELLAVLRLESHRNQCLIIGEDLGTFPPNYREAAADAGLLSYRVLFFEKDENGDYLPPDRYPPLSLAAVSTHDLPTWIGWWKGADLAEKEKLHIYATQKIRDRERQDRERDRPSLSAALRRESLSETCDDAHQFLARSAAAICMLQLEDVLGVEPQANLPGTIDTYPNWRRRLPFTLEEVFAPNSALCRSAPQLDRARAAPDRDVPVATYRLQFHKGFTFHDAIAILPYLSHLGISHVYASPWLKARPDSTHGYDITNHRLFNPELGGEEGYTAFSAALHQNGLRQILDFVPNHMGIGGSDNAWWLSVLEWGQLSPFVDYFDINWRAENGGTARLILPVLGNDYGDVLDAGELVPRFDAAQGSLGVWYHEHLFPLCPTTYHMILQDLPMVSTYAEGEQLKLSLRDNASRHLDIAMRMEKLATDKTALHTLLECQAWRVAFWRVASSEINYRRFFDIHDLAGLRMESPEVFAATHGLVLREIYAGRLHGLRIDHIDGLADPEAYCSQLRAKVGSRLYVLVEKILGLNESLRVAWPIEGTTGYDQLNTISGVLIDTQNETAFDDIYRRFTSDNDPFDIQVANAKGEILSTVLLSELSRLANDLRRIATRSPYTRDYPLEFLRLALQQVISFFPIYRTYVTQRQFTEDDHHAIELAVGKARKASQLADLSVYDFIASALSLEPARKDAELIAFVRRFQQLSGPAMAKGLEDTVFYRYHRLLALNEVGGHPSVFGVTPKSFHTLQQQRARHLPFAMSATATHDTKRGEDMRARLCVLSGMPQEFNRFLERSLRLNHLHYSEIEGAKAPSDNEEYFIYQTLLGSWPLELLTEPIDTALLNEYATRISAYMQKALREAKKHTSWNNPHEDYEKGVQLFLNAILNPANHGFLQELVSFARPLAVCGLIASLSQIILKLTLPGIPDIYQGTEFWDFSLVDPDNRRPVDYTKRMSKSDTLFNFNLPPTQWMDGHIKQQILCRLLAHRAAHSDLYSRSDYRPLELTGRDANDFIAFVRTHGVRQLIVCIPIRFGIWIAPRQPDLSVTLGIGVYRDILRETDMEQRQQGSFQLDLSFENFPYLILAKTSSPNSSEN